MNVLIWGLRLAVFLFLLVFAIQNTEPVSLHFVLGNEWRTPLVLLLLTFFIAGALLGILSLLGHLFALRREVTRLKKELDARPIAPPDVPKPPAEL